VVAQFALKKFGEGIEKTKAICLGNLGIAYYRLGEKEKACGLLKGEMAIFEPTDSYD